MFARRMFIGLLVALVAGFADRTASAADVAAPEAFVPTPAQLFGPLFLQVQMDALFPDGKTFPDAAAKCPTTSHPATLSPR